MKKTIVFITFLFLIFNLNINVFAEETDSADVYVTIADKGNLAISREKVLVSDVDDDGVLTINDALYCSHEAFYQGGADEGYGAMKSDYGLSITRLWGDTSLSYGYYVNNSSAWNLADPVKNGDHVYAFVYADNISWSDTYCYFESDVVKGEKGVAIELMLLKAAYDESWNPVTLPVEGATIIIDGASTELKTDADGKVILSFADAGEYEISAVSKNMILVPPVCAVKINDDSKVVPGDDFASISYFVLAILATAGFFAVMKMKKTNER